MAKPLISDKVCAALCSFIRRGDFEKARMIQGNYPRVYSISQTLMISKSLEIIGGKHNLKHSDLVKSWIG